MEFELQSCRDVILDSINEGVFTVDLNWRITSFNRAAEALTGVSREEAIGSPCSEVFRANVCEQGCTLRQTLTTGEPVTNQSIFIVDAAGERTPIKISTALLRDAEGEVIGGVETFQDLRQVEELVKKLEARYTFADIIGRSSAITRLFDILPQIALSDSSVLVSGSSGTGKELFARAIHNLSPRQQAPFVAINCGALPDSLLESELFGYKAGAFTDAKHDKPGRFALAEGGTLFLDEIGDISPAMQVRLLRVLQEHTFEPLGAVAPVHTNVRIVAATNKNLDEEVAQGRFRQDLYYRIHVVHLELPGLAQRREDIPLLAAHFIGQFNHLQGKEVVGFTPQALAALMAHEFPGNVRELENIVEYAFILCRTGMIDLQHLPPYLRQPQPSVATPPDQPAAPGLPGAGTDLKAAQRDLIADALRRHQGKRGAVARELGIDASTLYRKIKKLQIPVPERDGRRKA
jgi:PAS domain S-box-containing protein